MRGDVEFHAGRSAGLIIHFRASCRAALRTLHYHQLSVAAYTFFVPFAAGSLPGFPLAGLPSLRFFNASILAFSATTLESASSLRCQPFSPDRSQAACAVCDTTH